MPSSQQSPYDRFPGAASGEELKFYRDLMTRWANREPEKYGWDFRFGNDSDDKPAVWVTITVKEVNPSDETIRQLRLVSNGVKEEILGSSFGRWPYIQIRSEYKQ